MKFFDSIMNFLGFEKVMGASKITWKRRPGLNKPQPRPRPAPKPANDKPIEYLLNDPTTPDLVVSVAPPIPPAKPAFAVAKYQGGGFPRGSVEAQAANCFVTATKLIEFVNKYTDVPLQSWAGTQMLTINPRAGVNLNAYYDRRNLKFFYFSHERTGTMFTCDSADIVAHELGHAILDSYRPELWSAASLEVAAFHEAFGDFLGMMYSLSHPELVNHVLAQTSGDLTKHSVLSNVAEQMGQTLFKLVGNRNPNCLRCAINDFKYVNPSTLPEKAADDMLAAECHSFARIFVGALYEILVMIYNEAKAAGMAPTDAIAHARDTLMVYMMKAIRHVPANVYFFDGMARTLLWADVTINNRKYHDKMQEIFFARNLQTPQIRMLSAPACDNEDGVVHIQSTLSLKLGDHLLRAQSDDNPLYDVEVEIPHNQAHLYDNEKNLVDSITVSEEDSLSGAQDMIIHLHKTGSVSDDPMTPFEVNAGKLVRTHFI